MTEKNQVSAPYYNIGQLRVDYWNDLKKETAEIARSPRGSDEEKEHIQAASELIKVLEGVECFFAFPGMKRLDALKNALSSQEFTSLANHVSDFTQQLVSDSYRTNPDFSDDDEENVEVEDARDNGVKKNYFEVLFVEDMSHKDEQALRARLNAIRDPEEQFNYGVVVQRSFQGALMALLFNYKIQAVVIRYSPPYEATNVSPLIKPYIQNVAKLDLSSRHEADLGPILGKLAQQFRPELNTYYVTDTALADLKDSTIKSFSRIFYRREDLQEIHLTILSGIGERYETPFFSALKEYSQKPMGVFHAMPISRGNSVFKSRWINDFGEFYGRNMFLAETSATTGGLDSLLQPTGPLKKAQEMARDAYGSQRTFFVTNGTSTANKIVMQALVQPGDLVLIDRDCHKSHHYGIVLSGAYPVYLDSYPIEEYSMYGAVPLEHIKAKFFILKEAGRLDKVKMLLLTNCTFDGMVYNVKRVMEEVLAIKPDMIFLWDEAWFAFAGFTYTYKQRTGMYIARKHWRVHTK